MEYECVVVGASVLDRVDVSISQDAVVLDDSVLASVTNVVPLQTDVLSLVSVVVITGVLSPEDVEGHSSVL